ncbi:LacI family DNA-binding transcriptional regulator [Actinopolymorpha sp. B17G11]|uniref:LacI family DNA-binding transcriptional regulator n=1 Tax=Actinopolymorpha sp. B17G11 TaxID=3160861 RepID=UPI0032E4CB05
MGTRRRSTLRDVAQRAGVSVGTASGVFTSNSSVSDEARAAVLAAASEIGYHPRRRQTKEFATGITTFGLLARAEHYVGPSNPFYGPVLYGAQWAVGELGLSLVLETLRDEPSSHHQMPLIVERRQAQGLLLAGYVSAEYITAILRTGTPCVVIDHHAAGVAVDSVCADDHRGGYLATMHLLELGHRDPPPAIITGPSTATSIEARFAGYRDALTESGIPVEDAYVREGRLSAESGRDEMRALLDLTTPPTAVFCCNDNTAIGAIDLLREKGIAVPDEFSVIGYDDIDMAAQTVPRLTTIAVDKEHLGMQAVWNLAQRVRHPQMGVRDTRLRVHLVERSSTAPRT